MPSKNINCSLFYMSYTEIFVAHFLCLDNVEPVLGIIQSKLKLNTIMHLTPIIRLVFEHKGM